MAKFSDLNIKNVVIVCSAVKSKNQLLVNDFLQTESRLRTISNQIDKMQEMGTFSKRQLKHKQDLADNLFCTCSDLFNTLYRYEQENLIKKTGECFGKYGFLDRHERKTVNIIKNITRLGLIAKNFNILIADHKTAIEMNICFDLANLATKINNCNNHARTFPAVLLDETDLYTIHNNEIYINQSGESALIQDFFITHYELMIIELINDAHVLAIADNKLLDSIRELVPFTFIILFDCYTLRSSVSSFLDIVKNNSVVISINTNSVNKEIIVKIHSNFVTGFWLVAIANKTGLTLKKQNCFDGIVNK